MAPQTRPQTGAKKMKNRNPKNGTQFHGNGEQNNLNCIKNLIEDRKTYEQTVDGHFETCAKYSKFIQERIQERLADLANDDVIEIWIRTPI